MKGIRKFGGELVRERKKEGRERMDVQRDKGKRWKREIERERDGIKEIKVCRKSLMRIKMEKLKMEEREARERFGLERESRERKSARERKREMRREKVIVLK